LEDNDAAVEARREGAYLVFETGPGSHKIVAE
jgi:hypothetical protein